MLNIEDVSFYAKIAFAAYGKDFQTKGISVQQEVLIAAGMAAPLAESMSSLSVVQHFEDATGAAMTLFEQDGKYFLGVRGTESKGDFAADLLLATGLPATLNPQFVALKAELQKWVSDPNILPAGAAFRVAGHSLGGYLASALKGTKAVDGGPEFNISEAYLYNSPGMGGVWGDFYDSYQKVFGFAPPGSNGIWNIQSEQGISLTSGLGSQLSEPILIWNENGATGIDNHSIRPLTATLAVMAVYQQLFGAMPITDLNKIDNASGLNMGGTPDSMLDALRRVMLPSGYTPTPPEDWNTFYSNLDSLSKAIGGAQAKLIYLGDLPAAGITSMASADTADGQAVRHALTVGSPFAVSGTGSADDAYTKFPFEYWQARADMLVRLNYYALQEQPAYEPTWNKDYNDSSNSQYDVEQNAWFDGQTGLKVQKGALTPAVHITSFGKATSDTMTGGGVSDTLFGMGGNDTLQGGYGDDTLVGGTGNDYLFGGRGADTYVYVSGDGNDTILAASDASGEGAVDRLVMYGVAAADVKIIRANSYDLYVDYAGARITINGWYAPSTQAKDSQLKEIVFSDGVVLDNEILSKLGMTMQGTAQGETLNVLNFGMTVIGGGGNDTLIGGVGADTYIYRTGDGSDTIDTGWGSDHSASAAGPRDRLVMDGISLDSVSFTHKGYDLYIDYAGERITVKSWYSGGPTAASNYRLKEIEFADHRILSHEVISNIGLTIQGTDGADTLSATGGWDNIIYGGEGADRITGDTGNDSLYGGAGDDTISGSTGIDTIFGGSGNDSILGGAGDDILEGGVGNDTLSGGDGADTYVYRPGDGSDRIEAGRDVYNPSGSVDRLVMAGIRTDQVVVTHKGTDLCIDYAGERISISNWYVHPTNGLDWRLKEVVFNDLTLDTATLTKLGLTMYGTEGADQIDATQSWDNIMYGGGGDDRLFGNNGNDRIYGGPGNDTLSGSYGNDTFFIALGEGTDRIIDNSGNDTVDFSGLAFADAQFVRTRDAALEIRFGDATLVHIDAQLIGSSPVIEDFVFNGVHYGWQTINSLAVPVA